MRPAVVTGGRLARVRKGILAARQRRLAWVGFLLLAAYSPVVAALRPDDTWLMPITVAGLVGYVLVVDDLIRGRAARSATPDSTTHADGSTRDRRIDDDPGSSPDSPAGSGQRPDR